MESASIVAWIVRRPFAALDAVPFFSRLACPGRV
jgi:hypothetical protein